MPSAIQAMSRRYEFWKTPDDLQNTADRMSGKATWQLYAHEADSARTSCAVGTSAEVGSLLQHRWQPASPERLCGTIVEMLTTVPVSSVSLTGLPRPNWTHLWRELLPSPWWRGVDLAGLLGMTTMPPLTEPTVELESGRTSSRFSGTILWRPTIGLDEDGAVLAGPAKPWTPACREAYADLWQLCSDWLSSADELTGPLNAFSVGAPLWNVECWTASRWTGSLDLEWGRTSRSWWSSQETGALWWLSGHAVELVPEYLLWSASRLSRRVASHLAALTATRRVSAAWWTPVEKSPVQTEDKWTGIPSCWPRNADICGQLDASVHEDRHPVCLSTPSTPDFWWQIRRTLVCPSWSAVTTMWRLRVDRSITGRRSSLLGNQKQPTVESQGLHVGDSLYGSLHQCGVDGSNSNGDQERNRKLPPQMVPDPNYRRHLNSRLRT